MATLLAIKGAPGYRIDCESQQAYSTKRGIIKPIKARTKYKSVTLSIDGKNVGSTIYRMMYCAQHDIDITKLPTDICFSIENGSVTVLSREQVVEKANLSKAKAKCKMERLQTNLQLIASYYAGNVAPLLKELNKIEKKTVWYFIDTRGFSKQKAELIAANGVNKYLDALKEGVPNVYILQSVKKYAYGYYQKHRQQFNCEFIENIKPIEI